jgi:hypothetical protein
MCYALLAICIERGMSDKSPFTRNLRDRNKSIDVDIA